MLSAATATFGLSVFLGSLRQVLSYAPDVILVNLCNPTLERTLGVRI